MFRHDPIDFCFDFYRDFICFDHGYYIVRFHVLAYLSRPFYDCTLEKGESAVVRRPLWPF
jgi:hypothetical protein